MTNCSTHAIKLFLDITEAPLRELMTSEPWFYTQSI